MAHTTPTGPTLSQVQVELKKGETIMTDASLHLPAAFLHEAFSDRSGVPPSHFELYYRGKQLEGGAALSSYGIGKNATIEVKMRGRGGVGGHSGRSESPAVGKGGNWSLRRSKRNEASGGGGVGSTDDGGGIGSGGDAEEEKAAVEIKGMAESSVTAKLRSVPAASSVVDAGVEEIKATKRAEEGGGSVDGAKRVARGTLARPVGEVG